MKISNPKTRYNLGIKKTDYVLEVGGGHNPHPRANVIVDKYTDDNSHRSGDLNVGKNQVFIQAEGELLPFKDKEFDYVICAQVLEHATNPSAFLNELFRVSKGGYLETPSLIGEYLFPKDSHEWVILEINKKICVVRKSEVLSKSKVDFGDLFLEILPRWSLAYKILQISYPNIDTVRYEWCDEIDYKVENLTKEELKYFNSKWSYEMYDNILQFRNIRKEFAYLLRALFKLFTGYLRKGFRRY